MYKGHVSVILYDEKGKEIHRQENHNLVTNATAEMIKMVGGASGGSTNLMNSVMPIATKALGGLILFDGVLEENANKYEIPTSVHVVACAGRNQDSTNQNAGSLNESETTKISGGYQTVWDFNTSQANKAIASLALTSDYAGENIFDAFMGENFVLKTADSLYNVLKDVNGNVIEPAHIFPLKYDRSTQTFYFLRYKGNYSDRYHYSVCYVRIPLFEYEVADSFTQLGTVYETETVFEKETTLEYGYGNVDVKGGYAYIPYTIPYSSTTVNYMKMSLSDFTYSDTGNIAIAMGDGSYKRLYVSDGYLYSLIDGEVNRVSVTDSGLTHKYVLKQGVSDLVTLAAHKLVANAEGLVMAVVAGGIAGTYKNYALYRDLDNTIVPIKIAPSSKYYTITPVINGMVVMYVYNGILYFAVKRDYLGTIFNLQTPVPKTQATSMKVVYTLTNV